MKKFLAAVMAIAMVLSLVTVPTFADSCTGGEDDYYLHIGAEEIVGRKVTYSGTYNEIDVSMDVTFQGIGAEGDVDNGLYWRSFTGGWGTAYAGYDAKNQQWIIAVGDGASYAGYATAPYVWEAGVEHNLRITHVGKTLTLYVDGVETISSEHDMNISEGDSVYNGSASDGMSGTITSYLSAWDIDNVIYKTMDGTELTNIDFSEADINDLLPDAADGAWYGDKVNGSGSIEFVTLPAPGGEDDYYWELSADTGSTNGKANQLIGYDYDAATIDSIANFEASADITYDGMVQAAKRNQLGFEFSGTGYGFIDFTYNPDAKKFAIVYGYSDPGTAPWTEYYDYDWTPGEEHNFKFVKNGNNVKFYLDGNEILNVTHDDLADLRLAGNNMNFISRYTYAKVDNVIVKNIDSGSELTNIDFSEADAMTKYFAGTDTGSQEPGAGEVKFIPAPSSGEDDYYFHINADETVNKKVTYAGTQNGLDVSMDLTFQGVGDTSVVDNPPNGLFFRTFTAGWGTAMMGYDARDKVWKIAVGDGASYAGYETAAYDWAAGTEHNVRFTHEGTVGTIYVDGEKVLQCEHAMFGPADSDYYYDGSASEFISGTITTYLSSWDIDNVVYKALDGTELSNIDFSEADISDLFVDLGADGWFGGKTTGTGSVEFVPAPSGTPDDYYFNVNAENVVSGNTTHKIGYDYDADTVDSINNWQVTWEIACLSKADGSSGTRGGFGVQFSGTGYGFMDFGYISGDPKVGATFGGFQPGKQNDFDLFKPLTVPYEWFAGLAQAGLPIETKIRMGLKKEGNTVTLLWMDNPLCSNTDDAFNDLKLSNMYFSTVDAYVNLDNIIVKNLDSGTELTNIDFSEANIDELFAPDSSWSSSTVGGGSIDYIPGTSTGHDWADATCTEPRTCRKCGKTAGAALGHDFGEYVYDNNATCTEDGTKTAACSRCDATDTVADADHPAMNHSFTNYVYNEDADCVTDGTMTAKCDRCDVTDTKADPNHTKLGHDFGDAQCGSVAKCDRCGEEDPSGAVSHVPDRDAPTCTDPVKCTRANCSLENNIIEAALGHSFTIPATCTTAGKCDRCGSDNPDAPALNHPTTVHNRCTICGHIPGLAEGPKDKMSSNTSDKVLYSNGITGAAYTETDAEYENFTWIMNANIRDFADKDGSYMGLWLCDGFGGRAIYDFKKQQFIISNGSEDLATYDYVWPINDTASVEFAVEKNDKTVTIYVDGEAVATATDDAFAGKRKIFHFNDACEMYTDYILIAPVGYLADRNAMRNDIMAKIIFDGMSDACDLSFLSSSSFEVKTMEDNWVRFGYTAGNYNLGDEWDDTSKYTLTMDVIFDNGFIADNQSYGSRFHTFVGNTNGDTGIAVGYSISEGKAYIMDIASKTVFAEKEFAMPMDELVQWAVRVTPEKDDWGDDVTRVELIINGEVVVTYADPSFAHSGDFSKYLAYRIFNTCMKIRGFNVNNDAEVPLITPHAGGTANCTTPAICDECGKPYGAIDANNHQFGEDSYYYELSADTGSNGKASYGIGFDYDDDTLAGIKNFEVSADITYTGTPETVDANMFGFEFSGTDCGFMEFGYFTSPKGFSAVYGGGGFGSNSWGVSDWPQNTASYKWEVGSTHTFTLKKNGTDMEFYVDGEKLLTCSRDGFSGVALQNLLFITKYTYVNIDNIVVKNSDSGNVLTDIDFSEENATTELFVTEEGTIDAGDVGALKMVPATPNYVSDGNATCTDDGTKTATCVRCGYKDTIADEGSALGHAFTNYVYDNNGTCTEDGTMTAKCDRCDATDTKADPEHVAPGHSFTNYVYDDNATCTDDGTKTAKCDNCDATDTVADPEHPATGHHYGEDGKCVNCGEPAPLQILVGDIDGDGEINAKDATLLKRYLAGWNVEANIRDQSLEILKISADANQDGEVNAKDATLLTRYLASWDVESAINTTVIPAQ